MNTKISIIAAIGKNRELGKDNKLLWHIKEDLQHFKKITTGHPIIMGQKTFESLGKPLPNRTNIVLTLDKNYHPAGVVIALSMDEALAAAKRANSEEIFFAGGGQIYRQALPLADRLYLTLVDIEKEADTFFPDYSKFKKVISKEEKEENGLRFKFLILEK